MLSLQGKKALESGLKHNDSDKPHPDEPGLPEIIQETITEESYTEESINLESSEIDRVEVDESKPDDITNESKGDAAQITVPPHISNEDVSDMAQTGTVKVASETIKYLTEIEKDAVGSENATSVAELITLKVGGNGSGKFESVGSQCDITDPADVNIDESNVKQAPTDQKSIAEAGSVEPVNNPLTMKRIRKFDVVVTKPNPQDKETKDSNKSLTGSVEETNKDIDASTYADVIFDDVFGDKMSDDEHSKTITNESELLVQVIVMLSTLML